MNNRIRELAEQASIDCELLTRWLRPNAYIWTATDDELAKFAQLIVAECAEVGDSGDPLQDGGIGKMIKEHFGVE